MKIKNTSNIIYTDGQPPEEYFVPQSSITPIQLEEFECLLNENVNETEIDKFLHSNPAILVNSLKFFSTGHHGAWVIPQRIIKPPMGKNRKGLRPDYILGGCNSEGFSWVVLELKGPNVDILCESNNYLYLSPDANKAVGQTLEYIDYCASIQSYLRDTLLLNGFREPKGVIIIGREKELLNNPRKKQFKAAWNRYMGNKIEIRTYDAILRHTKTEVELSERSFGD